MWRTLRACLPRLMLRRYRRRIEHVLALVGRGEVRCDGLRLNQVSNRLEIQWRARDIHPWDRDLPRERRAPIFVEQSLADTETAISRLFETFPELDVIDLSVLDPESEFTMIAGTIDRSAWTGNRRRVSLRMRLSDLGVRYRFPGALFEALDSSGD
jgi:hypothetical protein